jgi:Secretion system C-terminal sorting domain
MLCLVLFGYSISYAQSVGYLVHSTDTGGWNHYSFDVKENQPGEFYMTGLWATTQTQYPRASLRKTDASGNTVWNKMYLNGFNSDNVYGLCVNDQSVYMCGLRAPANFTDPILGLIIRTDTSGNLIWMRGAGAFFHGPFFSNCCLGPTGSCIAVGNSTDPQTINYGYVCRFDSTGNMLWGKSIQPVGFDFSILNDVILLPDSSIYAVGYCKNLNSSSPNPNGWIVKLDQQGNILWSKYYSMNGNANFNCILKVGNDLFLSGGSQSFDSISGIFYSYPILTKIDTAGNEIWTKHYLFSQHDFGSADKLRLLPSGNMVMTANVSDNNPNTLSEFTIMEVNPNGVCVNTVLFPYHFIPMGLQVNSTNGQVFTNGYYEQTPFLTQWFYAEVTPNWQPWCNVVSHVLPLDSIGELNENPVATLEFMGTDTALVSFTTNMAVNATRCDYFVGIEEETATFSIETFPNPATNQVQITFTNSTEDRTAELFDVNGRCVRILNIAAGTKSFSLERGELTTGMYVLRMEKANVKLIFTE